MKKNLLRIAIPVTALLYVSGFVYWYHASYRPEQVSDDSAEREHIAGILADAPASASEKDTTGAATYLSGSVSISTQEREALASMLSQSQ